MKNIRLTATVLAVAAVSTGVRAGDKWCLEPQTDGYWHTAANWGGTPAGLPTAATSISVTRTRETAPVQILAGEAYMAKSLALSESNVGTQYCGHLQIAGSLTNSDFLTVGNDLVNSIHLSFTGIAADGYLCGELYATDRDNIPAGVPSHNKGKIVGVWRLPMTVSFGTARLRVRFDRAAVGPTDSVRLYRCDGAGKWSAVGTAPGTSEAVSTAAPLAPLSAENGYLGWFAVVAFPNTGTLIRVN